ncbi:MAG: hypothetical protein IJC99_02580 [Clostridia bacterium]|nr:hypothetical protein [Clostridia bacterium]
MILYLFIITLSAAGITLANWLTKTPATAWGLLPTVLIVLGAVVAVILLDGLGAFLIRHLPERFFTAERRCFAVTKGECRLWRALGVRLWCHKIPELGGFSGFHKDHVREPRNSAYLARFLLESNYGVAIHLTNALTGFLLLLCFPTVTLPVAIVNLVLSLMPFGALRANTPGLQALYKRVLAREARAKQKIPT